MIGIARKLLAALAAAGVAAGMLVLAAAEMGGEAEKAPSAPAASSVATSGDGLVTLATRVNSTGATPASFRVEVRMGAIARRNNAVLGNLDWSAIVTLTEPGSRLSSIYSIFNDSAWQPISFEKAVPPLTYAVTARVSVDGFKGRFYIPSMYDSPTVTAGTPTISGKAQVGAKLTAKPGIWAAGTKLSYHWQINGRPIAKATKPAYTPVPANAGKKITVKVTGAKPNQAKVNTTSAPTKPVAKAILKAATPTIAGLAKVGRTLTARPGKWTAGTRFSYHWLANGKSIAGARAKTLKLTNAVRGKKIKVKITGTKAGYLAVTKISKATTPVRK